MLRRQIDPRSIVATVGRLSSSCRCRCLSSSTIKENDTVILKSHSNTSAFPIHIGNLTTGKSFSYKGSRNLFKHNDIIGKEVRQFVRSRLGAQYRIFRPTLAEYTDSCPRIVTPIYSQDCALIVSLLDLHPTYPGKEADRLEIFEAGTGNGSLTLHLARAIHAANKPPPRRPEAQGSDLKEYAASYERWLMERRAVVHTLDIALNHSTHAEAVIKNFMQGMYAPHIDFHVGQIDDYLNSRLEEFSKTPFLDHAILDLPGAHEYIEVTANALKDNGSLILFVPSITQINKAVLLVKEYGLPLYLDKVLEVGGSAGVGGREWDVRPVRPRALLKAESVDEQSRAPFAASEALTEEVEIVEAVKATFTTDTAAGEGSKGWEMVCRPKVGVRTSGGGFLGLWKKIAQFE